MNPQNGLKVRLIILLLTDQQIHSCSIILSLKLRECFYPGDQLVEVLFKEE